MKKYLLIIICLLFSFSLIACNYNDEGENEDKKTTDDYQDGNPKVIITLSNNKTIKLELYPEVAPISVSNFLSLVDEEYYDGVVFHRVIYNFMIQTGGYYVKNSTIYQKDATKTIKGEFSANGVENNIKHEPGVISMARSSAYDSGSSQFFICTATSTYLDGNYAAFGKTIDEESLENAIEISAIETTNIGGGLTDFPVNAISIKTIRRMEEN